MAQVQEIWNKLNPRERLTGIGALVIILGWIVGLTARGLGIGSLGLLGAVAVLVVLYLKYANPDIKWPIHVSLIILADCRDRRPRRGADAPRLVRLPRHPRHQRPALARPVRHRRAADGVGRVAGVPGGEAGVAEHVGQLGVHRLRPRRAPPAASARAGRACGSPARGTGRSGRGAAVGASAALEQLERRHDLGTSSRHHTGRAELTARPRHVCRADRRATMLRRT